MKNFFSILLLSSLSFSTGCSIEQLSSLANAVLETKSSESKTESSPKSTPINNEDKTSEQTFTSTETVPESGATSIPAEFYIPCFDALKCMAKSSSKWNEELNSITKMMNDPRSRLIGQEVCKTELKPKFSKECL